MRSKSCPPLPSMGERGQLVDDAPNNSLDSEQELRRQRRDKRTVRQVELGVVALAGRDPVAQAFGEHHAVDGSVVSIGIDEIAV